MSEYDGKHSAVKKVFTTDKSDKDFLNNLEVFDPLVSQGAKDLFKQEVGNHVKNIGRYRVMAAAELGKGIREKQSKQKAIEFERIVRYIWEHRVSCLTTDILNHIFGQKTSVVEKKLIDNRMQDVKFSSHYGKDFTDAELKFYIYPREGKGEGWQISNEFKGSFQDLLKHCLSNMSKRGQYSVYNKKLKTSGKEAPSTKRAYNRKSKPPAEQDGSKIIPDVSGPIVVDGAKPVNIYVKHGESYIIVSSTPHEISIKVSDVPFL
jgi:hypothetical protein